ncbi:transposase [Synechococcus sp. PCC 6312]|uniref:transposase n=1 Tax=Synechococcus sp. (strain ATCC 27167 / PCC 6312) TaxID=195253 RepID=UPI00155A5DC0|nr:transposase [Synechococcus sp. PCC 6312]
MGAQTFAQAVRSHWGIENQRYWVLDVAFSKEHSCMRKDHAPENVALIRHRVLNLFRQDSSTQAGLKSK